VTDDELRKAVERQRRLAAPDVLHEDVYPGDDYQSAEFADLSAIAEAWLADHPEDSDLPVTADWLRSVGFENVYEDRWHSPANSDGEMLMYCPMWAGSQWAYGTPDDGCGSIPGVRTRGHVRRLCAALGIPLA
jgi:hypothetical protein